MRNLRFLGALLFAVAQASPIAAQGAFDKVPKRPASIGLILIALVVGVTSFLVSNRS